MSKPTRPFDPKAIPALHDYLEGARSIHDAFGVYQAHVMPKNAGPSQILETRRAFYAAADWVYQRILASVDDEADAMRLLSELGREVEEWKKAIIEGLV